MTQLTILSLGAGVQSTTTALMVKHGDLPMIDAAIFADTGWEPQAVYEHLAWLESVVPFPVHRVSAGSLRDDTLARNNTTGGRFSAVPWFLSTGGLGRRQCTKEYKIRPIQRKVRELLDARRPKGACSMWIGISMDEALRRKPSVVGYIVNRWPLRMPISQRPRLARAARQVAGRVGRRCRGRRRHPGSGASGPAVHASQP